MLDALEQQLLQSLIDKQVAVAKFLNMSWCIKKCATDSSVHHGYIPLVIAASTTTSDGVARSTSRSVKVTLARRGGCYDVKVLFVTVPADLARAVECGLSEALTKELRAHTLKEMLSGEHA
jgi:hypothetical protein